MTTDPRILCLGINYRATPVEVRERLAFREGQAAEAAQQIRDLPGFEEAVVLSTCNRVELYATHSGTSHSSAAHAFDALRAYLSQRFSLSDAEATALQVYQHEVEAAARHLFRVVSGLDSMVLGETEIFGQVKAAYQTALAGGTTSRVLNKLFQRSFTVGKAVREKTGIQRGSTSVGNVAVDLAEKIFGRLDQCRVMLIGAGEMSRVCAQSLLSRGARSVIVSNRSFDKAAELAAEMKGRAITFDEWETALAEVDIVISSTSAPHFVVKPEAVAKVMRTRRGHPLFLIDIAVPRDIDPAVNDIDDAFVYDIDALQAIADEGRRERLRQLAVCEQMIDDMLVKFGFRLTPVSCESPTGSQLSPIPPAT